MNDTLELTPSGGWRTPGTVRIPPIDLDKAGIGTRLTVKLINRIGKLEASNLFLMLLRNFRLFRAWLGFASRLMPFGEIGRRETELVILRVGWNCRARYEWGQHVDIALRAGVAPIEIARVAQGPDAVGWDERTTALLRACDEIHHDRMVGESTWSALGHHYDPRRLLEVLMLIGHYEMLAGILNTTGLPLDSRLEKVLAAAPIHVRN